jgi:SAM-dependent methyltransferase
MNENLKRRIPKFIRPTVKRYYLHLKDTYNQFAGHPTRLVPPEDQIFIGGGDFEGIGNEFFAFFKDLCGLTPNQRVLDVGVGIGRMAVPLTRYLNRSGRFDGFDIVPSGIEWCQQNLSSRFPNFHFELANIYNKFYNPTGTMAPSEYRFPYPDGVFDLVYLTSVFTHMLPPDVEHYMAEITRVLKPNGCCFSTYFLLNAEARGLIEAGKSSINFQYKLGDLLVFDDKVPEQAVCLPEEFVLELYTKYKLKIVPPIHYGFWNGKPAGLTYQDAIIARKG